MHLSQPHASSLAAVDALVAIRRSTWTVNGPCGSATPPGRPWGAEALTTLRIELERLTPAERRDLANALFRAAWSAALQETRILLLDLLLAADESVLGEAA